MRRVGRRRWVGKEEERSKEEEEKNKNKQKKKNTEEWEVEKIGENKKNKRRKVKSACNLSPPWLTNGNFSAWLSLLHG